MKLVELEQKCIEIHIVWDTLSSSIPDVHAWDFICARIYILAVDILRYLKLLDAPWSTYHVTHWVRWLMICSCLGRTARTRLLSEILGPSKFGESVFERHLPYHIDVCSSINARMHGIGCICLPSSSRALHARKLAHIDPLPSRNLTLAQYGQLYPFCIQWNRIHVASTNSRAYLLCCHISLC